MGLGCKYNHTLAWDYLIKALLLPNASLKCSAQSALIDWYMSVATVLPTRYIFAASHHANITASLSHHISPKDFPTPPTVLWFMLHVFNTFSESIPELCYFFKDVQKAMEERNAQVACKKEKIKVKWLKDLKWYRWPFPWNFYRLWEWGGLEMHLEPLVCFFLTYFYFH